MNDLSIKIQMAINTLQDLDIKSTFDNMNHIMGAIQTLAQVRDALDEQSQGEVIDLKEDAEDTLEGTDDGNADAE